MIRSILKTGALDGIFQPWTFGANDGQQRLFCNKGTLASVVGHESSRGQSDDVSPAFQHLLALVFVFILLCVFIFPKYMRVASGNLQMLHLPPDTCSLCVRQPHRGPCHRPCHRQVLFGDDFICVIYRNHFPFYLHD